MRHLYRYVPGVVLLVLALGVRTPALAQSVDPGLQGRVFQSSDGALWIYKDGAKYPLLGVDLSDQQIDAIPAMVNQPVGQLNDLFATGAPAPGPVAAASPPPTSPLPPLLQVGNPQPNDRIPAGLDMRGVAYDPLASSGSGVDRVQLFVEDRDKGGVFLGDASFGGSITNGWEIVVNLPFGPHTLFVYARSAVTGQESVTIIPVQVTP